MIGGPVGWPIGGIVSSEAEVFNQKVAMSIGTNMGFAPFVIGKRVDVTADIATSLRKVAAYRLQSTVSLALSLTKALPRLIGTSATLSPVVRKSILKPLTMSVQMVAHPVITGIAYLKIIAASLRTGVRFGPRHIVRHVLVTSAPAVSIRKGTTQRVDAVVRATAGVTRRVGKIVRAVISPFVVIRQRLSWTLTIVVRAAMRVNVRKAAAYAWAARFSVSARLFKTPGKVIAATFSTFSTLATQIYRFFRPRSMKTGISGGRGRSTIEAGHASSTVDD